MACLLRRLNRMNNLFILNKKYSDLVRKSSTNIVQELKQIDPTYSTKFYLKETDYEQLWSLTKPKLELNNSKIEFNDFKQIIQYLNVVVDYWKHKEVSFKNKPIRYLVNNLFSDSNTLISKNFSENHANWSILYDNLPRVSQLIDNKPEIISKLNLNINSLFNLYLFESILKLQSDHQINSEEINEASQVKIDLKKLKFYSDLSESLYEYLNKCQVTTEEVETFLYIKTVLLYIESYLLINKSSINYLLENKDKTNSFIVERLQKINSLLEILMKNYKNFDSIQEFKQNDFLRSFCFIESKWLYTAQWLLNTDKSELSFKNFLHFILALQGAVRFERLDYFEKLFKNLHEMAISKNIIGKALLSYNLVFRDFLNTQLNTSKISLEENLNFLLKLWSTCSYTPNQETANNLMLFIENLNSKTKNLKWSVNRIRVNTSGRIEGTGYFLERAVFNKQDLNKIANLMKEKILSQNYLKSEKEQELDRIDNLLEERQFDFVVDGMNIIYLRPNAKEYDNISNLVNLFNAQQKNRKCLIFLRDHVFNKFKAQIEKIEFLNKGGKSGNEIKFFCIDSIFEDDKFFLYSALKSGPNTLLISNDYFNNQTHFLNGSSALFKEWLFSRKVGMDYTFRRFFYPPVYKLKCNQINSKHWVVPIINDVNNSRNHSFISIQKKIFS